MLRLGFDFELCYVLICSWMVFFILGIDLVDYLFEGMCIDIVCLFVDSSKNPKVDPRARLKSLVGNLGIKSIDNLIALFLLGA